MSSEAGGGLYPDSADEAAPDPSAILAGMRVRYLRAITWLATFREADVFAADVPRLLAAVDAVLKLADEACELEVKGVRLDWWTTSPAQIREAITSALTGKEGNEDE